MTKKTDEECDEDADYLALSEDDDEGADYLAQPDQWSSW